MKTRRFTPLFLAASGMAGLLACACSRAADAVAVAPAQPATSVQAAPAPARATPTLAAVVPAQATPAVAAAPVIVVNPDAATAWSNIKDLPFEQRADFVAGLSRLEGIVDTEIGSLNAKRAAMTTDTKDWDFEMKGLVDNQAYLKAMNDEVSKADPDGWIQEKEKVDAAWQNTQDAYAKVLHSTTSP
jgi:hypothetical protein